MSSLRYVNCLLSSIFPPIWSRDWTSFDRVSVLISDILFPSENLAKLCHLSIKNKKSATICIKQRATCLISSSSPVLRDFRHSLLGKKNFFCVNWCLFVYLMMCWRRQSYCVRLLVTEVAHFLLFLLQFFVISFDFSIFARYFPISVYRNQFWSLHASTSLRGNLRGHRLEAT